MDPPFFFLPISPLTLFQLFVFPYKGDFLLFLILIFFLKIHLFERERVHIERGGAEGEGEKVPNRLHTELRAQFQARSHDPEITT